MKISISNKVKPSSQVFDNVITWFEIPAANFERAVKFYNEIFGIDMETNVMRGYSMAFFPVKSGISGAIITGEGSAPCDRGPLLYLNAGDNLEEIQNRIHHAGGRVLMSKQLINEESGHFALFIDSEGNKLALHSKA